MLAAVDLGSNSFRMHIAEPVGDRPRIVRTVRDPIRLGAGLDARGWLTPEAMQAALDSLQRMSQVLAEFPITAVRVVATNTWRVAGNGPAFLPEAERAIGYPIEIISGEEEGRLIYLGVNAALGSTAAAAAADRAGASAAERRLVVDIGGGSTELILGTGPEIVNVESFTIGTVTQSVAFFPDGKIDAKRFDAAVLSARSRFEDLAHAFAVDLWDRSYGSSGTMRAIAEAIARNALGNGRVTLPSLYEMRDRLIRAGDATRIDLVGMKPDRAGVIMGGLAVLIGLMEELAIPEVTPVEAGLRLGVLTDLMLRAAHRDRREVAVGGFLARFQVDAARAQRVAEMAQVLFAQLKPAGEGLHRLLWWSSLLHEVGMIVSHSGYHKHGAYIVENADLPGFTTREQRMLRTLVLGQKGNLRKLGEPLQQADMLRAVLALRLAVLFMHARLPPSLDGVRLRLKSRIDLEIRPGWVQDHPTLGYWLDKEGEQWRDVGVDFAWKLSSGR